MPHRSSSSPKRLAYARMAASTASMCRRSESDSVHSQSRFHEASREISRAMAVTLAQRSGAAGSAPSKRRPRMEKFVIEGGAPLSGTVVPAGNKNAALPILAASVLTEDEVVLRNVPRIRDVESMLALLRDLGVRVDWRGANELVLCAGGVDRTAVDREQAGFIRASFLVAGPLLARFGNALMPPPGGDVIGRRRLDPHVDAFSALGADFDFGSDISITAPTGGLQAGDVFMDEPSVMATENVLMAAALTPGATVVHNAACEPHVQDLARMLVKMGADIQGIGSNLLTVNGVERLRGCEHEVGPDHIEIASFMALAGVTGGELRIRSCRPADLYMIRLIFERLGLGSDIEADDIDWAEFGAVSALGVTAGASAPEVLVEEVLESLAERYRLEVDTVSAVEEDVIFPPPRALRGNEAAE